MSFAHRAQALRRLQAVGLKVAVRGTDSAQVSDLGHLLEEHGLIRLDGDALSSAHAALILGGPLNVVEAVHLLRRQERELPLMMLSEAWNGLLRTAAYQAGADDCAPWPIDAVELAWRLRRLIHRCGAQSDGLLVWGDLQLDPPRYRVSVGSRESKLEPRAFAILCELVLAKGRPLSRSRLIDRVWTDEHEPSAGALEFQVHRLREVLGAERIQTLRGFGYALQEAPASAQRKVA